MAVISLCMISTITGIGKALSGYIARDYHGTVKVTTKLSFKTGILGVIILIVFGLFSLFNKHNFTETIFFFTAACIFLPYTILCRFEQILVGFEKFKELFWINTTSRFLIFLATVIAIVIFKQNILAYGLIQLLFPTLLFFIFFLYSIKFLNNSKVDEGFLNHSIILSMVGIGNAIITPGLAMYLNFAVGAETLAIYSIANRIPTQLSGIVKPIMNPISIHLAKRGSLDYNAAIMRFLPISIIIGIILFIITFMGIEFFGMYVIGEQYIPALYYAKYFSLPIIIIPALSLLLRNTVIEKNNKAYTISVYARQLFTIIGYILFVSKYGLLAVALVNTFGVFLHTLILAIFLNVNIRRSLTK